MNKRPIIINLIVTLIAGSIVGDLILSRGTVASPVLWFLIIVGVSAVMASVAALSSHRAIPIVSIHVHMLGLGLLGTMYIAAWIISQGSDADAAAPVLFAAAINHLNLQALRH